VVGNLESQSFDYYVDDTALLSSVTCDDRRGDVSFLIDDGSKAKVGIFINDILDVDSFDVGEAQTCNVDWSQDGGSLAQFGTYALEDAGGTSEPIPHFGEGKGEFFVKDLSDGGVIQGRITVDSAYAKDNASIMKTGTLMNGAVYIDFFATCTEKK
jgi:hypothetical protein